MPELVLGLQPVASGVALVTWTGSPAGEDLLEALTRVGEQALHHDGLRRLEAAVHSGDHLARRALQRSGFRLEGVRRQAVEQPDGRLGDLALFARLADDVVAGPVGFSGVMNAALPRKRLIAHVLMRDGEGHVLLCQTHFKPDWELPGGIVEPGEPPQAAAVREVREELGIDLAVGRLLAADWMPPYLGWEDALELIFDGGVITPAEVERYVLQPSEINAVDLVSLAAARQLVTALSHRRLSVVMQLPPDATAYLENGSPTT